MHFVGIGGVGMSGIAEVLCTLGYQVSGSDNADNAVTRRLASLGANVQRGHAAANVLGTDCVVVSSAITRRQSGADGGARAAHPDRAARGDAGRADALPPRHRRRRHPRQDHDHLARRPACSPRAGIDPTFVIGGQLLAAGANARLGGGDWLVAEADESDGSFLRLNPLIAVVTNIDADHLENYGGDFANVQAAFAEFLHRLPFYGLAVLCIDDAEVAALAAEDAAPRDDLRLRRRRRRARRGRARRTARSMRFTLCLPDATRTPVTLALPGRHNVQNALAAAAVGLAARRQRRGDRARAGRSSPASVAASTCSAALTHGRRARRCSWSTTTATTRRNWRRCSPPRAAAGRTSAWWSRSSRIATAARATCSTSSPAVLSSVDALVLTEVYPAGEAPIAGADAKSLARAIRARGRIDPIVVSGAGELRRRAARRPAATATCC